MLTLVLTRHGATARSEPEQHLGQRLDLPLSEAGRSAARALGERLVGVRFDRVLSSPLRRALETASLVAPNASVEADARLAEMDYGRWEGRTYAEIDATDAAARRRWEDDPAALPCPGGESGEQVARRIRALLDDLLAWATATDPLPRPEQSGDGPRLRAAWAATSGAWSGPAAERQVLAVAHSTTNRILLAVALGVPIRDYRRRFVQAPANLTVLRFPGALDDGARLLVGNDVSHIRGLRGETWG
jgi:broad specificity phosphatase PhoE